MLEEMSRLQILAWHVDVLKQLANNDTTDSSQERPLIKPASTMVGLTTAAGTYTHMAPQCFESNTYDTSADRFVECVNVPKSIEDKVLLSLL
jgi:hypothetical protein